MQTETQTEFMAPLPSLGLIRISGDGAKKLLQGQLTCDMEQITPTHSSLGAHCNPQGRIISLFQIFIYQDSYFLQMPRDTIPLALNALKKYAPFFKAALSDVSDEFKQIGCHSLHPLSFDNAIVIQPFAHEQNYYELISPLNLDIKPHLPQVDEHHWKLCYFRNTIPVIYPETSEKFLPHELNLPELDAVSFNKGCYTGQEIIARMHYRGKTKNHLYSTHVNTSLPIIRGMDVLSDTQTVGSIVDFCSIGYNQYQLLVVVQDEAVKRGDVFIDTARNDKIKFTE